MNTTSEKKQVLRIQEDSDESLSIGNGEHIVDEFRILHLDIKDPIPRISIQDILDHDIHVCLERDGNVEYAISPGDDGFVSVGYGITGTSPDWVFSISPTVYIEILKLSIQKHPQYSGLIDFKCHFISTNTAIFDFAVRVKGKYLDEVVESGFALMGEILLPIKEVEQLIRQKLKELT